MRDFSKEAIRLHIQNCNQARIELESRFAGLGHVHTTLIKSLISRADPITGLVEGLNYRDLADILRVNHAPGRKGCGTPQKETVRSYLRTIEDNCSDNFRLVSFGQKIKFQFIQMPKIYAYFFDQNELYTDRAAVSNSSNNLDAHETFNTVDVIPELVKSIHLPGEDNFENDAKKVLYINKQNKLTGEDEKKFSNLKQPITPNFYPTQETIDIALAKGYSRVVEPAELAAFIRHNQQRCTQWVDFNPVYLQWLERGFEYQQQKAALNQLRSAQHGNRSNQKFNRKSFVEYAFEQNRDAVSPSGKPYAIDIGFNNESTPVVVVDGINERIRAIICEQERRKAELNMVRYA